MRRLEIRKADNNRFGVILENDFIGEAWIDDQDDYCADRIIHRVLDKDELLELIDLMSQAKKTFNFSNIKSKVCTCGAKHTSNPKHHLSFCDIKEE